MNNVSLISIIIPVYNSEKYLDKCLNSVLNQTFSNLEIILINDGSNDNSPGICDEYAKRDNRIKVLHQVNQRQAAARNRGIDLSNGDYLMFIDSDDYIALDMCEFLLINAIKYKADIVTSPTASVDSKGNIHYVKMPKGPIIMNTKEAIASYVGASSAFLCGHSPCDKIYTRKTIGDVRFPEGKWFEDLATIYKFIDRAKKIVYFDEPKYFYMEHETSTMKKEFSKHSFDKIEAYNNIELHYREIYPEFSKNMNINKLGSILYCIGESYRNNKQNELNLELDWAISLAREMNSPLFIKSELLKMLLVISPNLFGIVYKLFK